MKRVPRFSRRMILTALGGAAVAWAAPWSRLPGFASSTLQARAQEQGAGEYLGRAIAPTMTYHGAPWLTREERDAEENTTLLLEQLRLRPGQVVCDLGCGNGYYTLRMAAAVSPGGWVYGSDIQSEMLTLLNERAAAEGVTNLSPILGTLTDPRIPAASCDLILLVDVYHEFSHPAEMLATIRRSLKPAGVVVLAEYREEDPAVPIKPLHKMSKVQVHKELTANGFKLVRQFDGLPWQHLMFYQRDDEPDEAIEVIPWRRG